MRELNKKHTYTFVGKTGLWILYTWVTGYSQNFMMKENLDSHGFLIMGLQDTSAKNWESGKYIVYQDNLGDIYTHPMADKNEAGASPTAPSSKSEIKKARKNPDQPENPEMDPKKEGVKKKGRIQKVKKVVPE